MTNDWESLYVFIYHLYIRSFAHVLIGNPMVLCVCVCVLLVLIYSVVSISAVWPSHTYAYIPFLILFPIVFYHEIGYSSLCYTAGTVCLFIFFKERCYQVLLLCFLFFCLFRAIHAADGGSQARGQIRAVATSQHHSHSNAGSKPRLYPIPQLTATLDP